MLATSLLSTTDDSLDRGLRVALDKELAEVEARFSAELVSDLACVNALVAHVERYRGKMLRPALVLLSAGAARLAPRDVGLGDADEHDAHEARLTVATVVEMVHMATLVHDDILDDAEVRRGGAAINRLAGNESAVMLGDYLISHAYHLCSSLGLPSISRAIAAATNTVCEGELLQLSHRGDWSLGEAIYRDIIRRKTASLCGVCCRLGARIEGVDDAVVQHLGRFGEQVGEAFQIVDDLLDLTGDEGRVGKTLGRDLQKGKLTLPLLRMLDGLDGDARRRAHALLDAVSETTREPRRPRAGRHGYDNGPTARRNGEGPAAVDPRMDALAALLRGSGALEASLAEARSLVERAKACLTEVAPDSPARRALLTLADRVVDRSA